MTAQTGKAPVSLKAMAEGKVEGVQKTTQFQVDPRIIEIEEGFNARPLDPDHVVSIKLAYKSGATLPALFVRVDSGRIILVDGHHRHAALLELIAEGAEVLRVDCTQFRGNDAERITLMLTSSQGKPLTPLEQGLQYKKLVGFGWSEKEIAGKVGKSEQHVTNMLDLGNANSDVQNLVRGNKVAAHVALSVVKEHGDAAGKVLAGHLEVAAAAGKKKVTNKTIRKSAAQQEGRPTDKQVIACLAKKFNLTDSAASDLILEIAESLRKMAA